MTTQSGCDTGFQPVTGTRRQPVCGITGWKPLPPLSLLAVLLCVTGCARPAGELFPSIGRDLVWPPPPDAPRLRYVGQLATDADLRPAQSGWDSFKEALAGPKPGRSVSTPSAVAAGADQRVYVADPSLRCVHVFDLRGRGYSSWTQAQGAPLGMPADVLCDDQRVLVSDSARQCVYVFNLAGNVTGRIGVGALKRPIGMALVRSSPGSSPLTGTVPSGIGDQVVVTAGTASQPSIANETAWDTAAGAIPPEGRLYVVDAAEHACLMFSPDGAPAGRFGRRGGGPGEFNFPTDVTVHSVLGVFVADTMNFRVQRFSFDGRFISAFGSRGDAAGDFALPKGVAVDRRGRLYVVDAQFENVQIFDPLGRLLLVIGQEGGKPGEFWLPNQPSVDQDERLWIADAYNRRVQVFQIVAEGAP